MMQFSSSAPCPHWLWGPLSLLSNGCRGGGLLRGVKRSGHEADHLHLRMRGAILPLPNTFFTAWHFIKLWIRLSGMVLQK
jgi:hypothetical protein